MQNEKRLIDANSIKFHKHRECGGHGLFYDEIIAYKEDIDAAPTVDAVEVVRCEECKFWVEGRHHCGRCNALVNFHDAERYMTESGHFCSYGEKKEKAEPEGEIDFDYNAEDC